MKGVASVDVIVPVQAHDFIKSEVPTKHRAKIAPLVNDAYALAEQATKDWDFWNWKLGHKNVGYLKRIAVEFMIKDAIDRGKLPFDYKIVPNVNKSAWHLEIITDNAIITTSQVQSQRALPNLAYFRKKLQEANQLRFSFNPSEEIKKGPYHLLITHGYGKFPSFINLGFPGPNGWHDCINIMKEPTLIEGSHEKTITSIDTEERLVNFKDFTKEVTNNETQ